MEKAQSSRRQKRRSHVKDSNLSSTKKLFFQLSKKTVNTIQFFREQLGAEEYTSYEVEIKRLNGDDGDMLVQVVRLKTYATSAVDYAPTTYMCRFTYKNNNGHEQLTIHAGDVRSDLVCFLSSDIYLKQLSSTIRHEIKSIMGAIQNKVKK